MSSMFRASPWVTYQPTTDNTPEVVQPPPVPSGTTSIMDMDVDMMDAPQISTLREEESPPPPTKKSGTGRKPKNPPKLKLAESWTPARPERKPRPGSEEEFEEQAEEEEDQLIDDDDDAGLHPSSATVPASARSADSTPKKKPAPKRKSKKEKLGVDSDKKPKEKGSSQPSGAHNLAPAMSWFRASPSKSHRDTGQPEIPLESASAPPEPIILKLSTLGKRKQISPRKVSGTPRVKAKTTKQKSVISSSLVEDTAMSEAGYTGTAASSPATGQLEIPDVTERGTPETENPYPPSSPPIAPTPLVEESNLENVAIPQYPLPTKPFPVQPPIKITSGFAPPIPLDRSGTKVRRWRTANREIRGIAGGRWFARTWVGDKESDYAASNIPDGGSSKHSNEKGSTSSGVAIPKLSGVSISAPIGGKGSGKRASSKTASAAASAVPSRAASAVPDGGNTTARGPTKMRILHLPPSENGGDSDMVPPEVDS